MSQNDRLLNTNTTNNKITLPPIATRDEEDPLVRQKFDNPNQGKFNPSNRQIMEIEEQRKIIRPAPTGVMDVWVKPLLAEFLATMLFVFIGCCQAMSGNVSAAAFAHGLTIAVLVACLADISGGHINPAVTISLMLAGGISLVKGALYIICQLLGSILGASIFMGAVGMDNYKRMMGGMTLYNASPGGITPGGAFLCEVFFTSLLIFCVLMLALDHGGRNPVTALYIGLSIVACVYAGANISGASLNPARTFGPGVLFAIAGRHNWYGQWVFYIAQILAAVVTALLYRFVFRTREI
ncbi:aquaporin-like isoform X2 [Gordionus sp. m RMFG-2023]|uniref:aquaporin-like isoform X2 n=1 Tax=Gordionus sp. m RMFG-2023 TaxID=3053472 RepID=UPI0031FBF48B